MIRIEELAKTYHTGFLMRPRQALQGVSLSVASGEIYGFIGPNGAGKSTTIKILLNLLKPSSGRVEILGKSPGYTPVRAQIGYLPEHPYFYDYLTGRELLRFYGSVSGLKGSLLAQRLNWALEMVHAKEDWTLRPLRTYSKGMMQRMGLAQAIMTQPRLLILDEPMSGLDPLGRRDVRETILELRRQGTTVFYSSHVLSDVETMSDRVAMVVDGRLVKEGTIAEITAQESSSFRLTVSPACPLQPEWKALNVSIQGQEIICPSEQAKQKVLAYCVQNDFNVLQLVGYRPSLEDVLTREVAREGGTHV